MIVDVDLVVFNCVFSRALDLNLCYIKDIISHIIVHIILFFEKKAPGRPGGFTPSVAVAVSAPGPIDFIILFYNFIKGRLDSKRDRTRLFELILVSYFFNAA